MKPFWHTQTTSRSQNERSNYRKRWPFQLTVEAEKARKKQHQALVNDLCVLQFLFVTGKGGVGKTSVASALALTAAAKGRRVLVVYPGKPPQATNFWQQPVTSHPTEVSPNVDALCVDPEFAMREYAGEVLGSTKLAAVLFHRRVAKGLLTGIPGPSDWAILGKAWSLTLSGAKARGRGDRPYDLVIVDAPASGDGSGMLRVPQVIVDLAPAARLRTDAESCLRLLRDRTKSAVLLVTLLEELSLSETEENLEFVRQDLDLPIGPIFVNQVLPVRFSASDRERVLSFSQLDTGKPSTTPEGAHVMRAAQLQARREQLAEEYLERVNSWQVPALSLPLIPGGKEADETVKKLHQALAQSD